MNSQQVALKAQQIVSAVEKAIVGKNDTVTMALAILLAQGHLLIEDIPGVGKTTLAKSLAKALGLKFKRIQFTPDLLPSDITGSSIYNQKTGDFEVRPGPVFANLVLADEINRTTPKTQAALLECMEEQQVTIDGSGLALPSPFFVIATQNNIEMAGTYPLPEAQMDRFMARIAMGYPDRTAEENILKGQITSRPVDSIEPISCESEILEMQKAVRTVFVDEAVQSFLLDIVVATRTHSSVALGASPRGALALQYSAQALAAIEERDFVKPDDIKRLAAIVLPHRMLIRPEQRIRGITSDECLQDILASISPPVAARIR